MKPPKSETLVLILLLLAASIIISVSLIIFGVRALRAAERIDIATADKLLGLLRSRSMTQATCNAALRMAEQDLELRKLMVDLARSHAYLFLVSGAAFFVLSNTILIYVRRLK